MTFEKWKKEIDDLFFEEIGLTSDDLPDWMYRDSYEAGETPEEVVDAVLEELDY